MKKSIIRTATVLAAVLSFLLVSCNKKDGAVAAANSATGAKVKAGSYKALAVKAEGGTATYDSILSFFKPDY